jgi:hypothetical protein
MKDLEVKKEGFLGEEVFNNLVKEGVLTPEEGRLVLLLELIPEEIYKKIVRHYFKEREGFSEEALLKEYEQGRLLNPFRKN